MTAERNTARWTARSWWPHGSRQRGGHVLLAAGARTPAAQAPADSAATHRAVLDRYCVTCHNARLKTAGLMLDGLDLAEVPDRRRGVGEGRPEAARRHDAARRARRDPTKRPRRRWSPGSRRRSTARARHGRIRDARRCIGSIAPSTRTPSAICSRSTSTPRRCCRPTIRATASTTSRTCSASRRRCSSATWAPPRRSARWRSATRRSRPTDQTYRVRFDLTQTRHIDGLPLGTRGGTLMSARRFRSTASTSSSRSSGARTSDSSAASRIHTRSRSRSTARACTWSRSARRRISRPP